MKQTLLLLLICSAACAQDPSSPEAKFTAEVRRVTVDVIATDTHGNPIRDLKREDIVIYENGVMQPILSFEIEDLTSQKIPSLKSAPAGFVSNYAYGDARSTDLTVILFDELNTSFLDALYARDSLEHLLRDQALANRPVSLFVLNRSLIRLHDFSTEPSRLLAAFKNRRPFLPMVEDSYVSPSPAYTRAEELPGDKTVVRQMQAMQEAQRNYEVTIGNFDVLNRVETTMAAMQAIAHSLHDRPGRKRLIWLSGGFPMSFKEPGRVIQSSGIAIENPAVRRSIERTSFLLTAARVSVFPIDARGLTKDPFPIEHPEAQPAFSAPDNTWDNQAAMMELADETGGKVYINRNDLDGAAREAVNDGRFYYAITYRPPETKKSVFRNIEVKSRRKEVKLRYRRGYYAPGSKERAPGREIRDVAVEPLLRNEVPFAAQGVLKSDRLATVTAVLPASALRLTDQAMNLTRVFDVAAVEGIYTSKPRLSAAQKISLVVPAAQWTDIQRNGLSFRLNLPLREGARTLRLLLRDSETQQIGSIDVPLSLPTTPTP